MSPLLFNIYIDDLIVTLCNSGYGIMEFGEAIKNPAYRIFQTEYSGCLDISAHA